MSWRPARDTPSVMIIMICISSPAAPDTKTRHEWARADKEAQGERERGHESPGPGPGRWLLTKLYDTQIGQTPSLLWKCVNVREPNHTFVTNIYYLFAACYAWLCLAGRGQCMFFSCGCCCAAGCCCWTSDLDQAALPIMLGQGGRVASQAAQPVLAVTNWLSQS